MASSSSTHRRASPVFQANPESTRFQALGWVWEELYPTRRAHGPDDVRGHRVDLRQRLHRRRLVGRADVLHAVPDGRLLQKLRHLTPRIPYPLLQNDLFHRSTVVACSFGICVLTTNMILAELPEHVTARPPTTSAVARSRPPAWWFFQWASC